MKGLVRLNPKARFRCLSWAVLLASLYAAACNDPYSRNRIARREENLREFSGDVQNSEARRAKRLEEAGETFERWWARDSARFERRWPTVGDYIW